MKHFHLLMVFQIRSNKRQWQILYQNDQILKLHHVVHMDLELNINVINKKRFIRKLKKLKEKIIS